MSKLSDQMAAMARTQTRTEATLYVQKHGLIPAYNYLVLNNKGQHDVITYHNVDHMLSVVKWSGRLASITGGLTSEKGLILGGLLHDMNHSGGTQPDTVNVALAVEALNRFITIHPKVVDPLTAEIARECIECTVYPFTVVPETLEQKIIRDADILHSIDINFRQILGEDLRREISRSRGVVVTRKQYAEGQLAFLESIQLHTEAGEILFLTSKPILVQHFEKIAKR